METAMRRQVTCRERRRQRWRIGRLIEIFRWAPVTSVRIARNPSDLMEDVRKNGATDVRAVQMSFHALPPPPSPFCSVSYRSQCG